MELRSKQLIGDQQHAHLSLNREEGALFGVTEIRTSSGTLLFEEDSYFDDESWPQLLERWLRESQLLEPIEEGLIQAILSWFQSQPEVAEEART